MKRILFCTPRSLHHVITKFYQLVPGNSEVVHTSTCASHHVAIDLRGVPSFKNAKATGRAKMIIMAPPGEVQLVDQDQEPTTVAAIDGTTVIVIVEGLVKPMKRVCNQFFGSMDFRHKKH